MLPGSWICSLYGVHKKGSRSFFLRLPFLTLVVLQIL